MEVLFSADAWQYPPWPTCDCGTTIWYLKQFMYTVVSTIWPGKISFHKSTVSISSTSCTLKAVVRPPPVVVEPGLLLPGSENQIRPALGLKVRERKKKYF